MASVPEPNHWSWPQWLAATEVFLMQFMVGISYGWTSPLIGKLNRPDPPFEATSEQISWIASLINLCRPIGVIVGTLITRYFGSKTSLLYSGLCYLVGWSVLALSDTIETVYASYIVCGIAMGSCTNTSPIFISEIASPRIRGSLMSLGYQGLLLGLLVGNLMGTHFTPWFMAELCLVPTILFLCTFVFFYGTPYYFISQNNMEKAKKSLEWYNPKTDMTAEFQNLVDFINASPKTSVLKTIAKFKEPINRNTLLIVNVIYSIIQLNGFFTLLEYMEVLFSDAEVNVISPANLVTVASTLSVITSWLAIFMTDKFGRVTLLFSAFVVMSITLFGWGLKYHLQDLGFHDSNLQWIVIVSALIYRISIVIGFTSVAPTIMSELFALDVKSFAICFCNITSAFCSFISNKNFQVMLDTLTHKYVFYIYGVITLAVSIYCKKFIPETKGKSLKEIQDILAKRFKVKAKEDDTAAQNASNIIVEKF